jgi:hypothetical protein
MEGLALGLVTHAGRGFRPGVVLWLQAGTTRRSSGSLGASWNERGGRGRLGLELLQAARKGEKGGCRPPWPGRELSRERRGRGEAGLGFLLRLAACATKGEGGWP